MVLRYSARRARRAAQGLLLAVLPEGGQRTARRNAKAGMARDAAVARARHDVDAAAASSRSVTLATAR